MKATILSKNGLKTIELNRRKAIHERCLNCVGWESHRVSNCEIDTCSLYPFRSGDGKQTPKARSQAIKEYCRECTDGKIRDCASEDCPLYLFRRSG